MDYILCSLRKNSFEPVMFLPVVGKLMMKTRKKKSRKHLRRQESDIMKNCSLTKQNWKLNRTVSKTQPSLAEIVCLFRESPAFLRFLVFVSLPAEERSPARKLRLYEEQETTPFTFLFYTWFSLLIKTRIQQNVHVSSTFKMSCRPIKTPNCLISKEQTPVKYFFGEKSQEDSSNDDQQKESNALRKILRTWCIGSRIYSEKRVLGMESKGGDVCL